MINSFNRSGISFTRGLLHSKTLKCIMSALVSIATLNFETISWRDYLFLEFKEIIVKDEIENENSI